MYNVHYHTTLHNSTYIIILFQHTKDFVFLVHKMVIGDINSNSKIDLKGTVSVVTNYPPCKDA